MSGHVLNAMVDLVQDLRHATRLFTRAPGITTVVVASLAVGIAANTAVFSFVNAIQFKPLPVHDEATLVDLSETSATELCAGCAVGTSYPGYVDWVARARSFRALAAYREQRFVVAGGIGPERVGGALASAGLFAMLGVQPALGRGFSNGDASAAAPPVAIISDMLWRRRFAAEPSILGRTMRVDGVERTIVGVMPEGFRFPEYAELWIPLEQAAGSWKRDDRSLAAIGRLRRDAGIEQARAELRAIAAALEAQYPDTNRGWTADVVSLREDMTGETVMASTVLLGAVGFVLLIACANVANLLLVRSLERRREIAIRLALGARRARIVRLVLTEAVVLAAIGGAIGLLAALWASSAIAATFAIQAPYWIQFGIDWRVFAFCAAATGLAALACGVAPAIQASRHDVQDALKDDAHSSSRPGAARIRSLMAAGQLALALVLLAGAGVLIKTVVRLFTYDVPYDATRVLAGDLHFEGPRYQAQAQRIAVVAGVAEQLERIPGVRVAAAQTIFFGGFGAEPRRVTVEGMSAVPAGASPSFYFAITPAYFSILGMSLREGRNFNTAAERNVVVVNDEMARRIWPGRSAVGARIRFGDERASPWLTVIGVAGDRGELEGGTGRTQPFAYVPLASGRGAAALYVEVPGDASAFADEVHAAVGALDADLPVENLVTMERALAERAAPARFVALLMASLAAIALCLAAMGTYAVIAYGLRQRSREIGIRLALGATPRTVQALMARAGLRLVAGGLVAGLGGAWLFTRMLEGILFGTSPTDPAVLAVVASILAAFGLLASWLPARRAARVDPLIVLRAE